MMKKLFMMLFITATACTDVEKHTFSTDTVFNQQQWQSDIPSRAPMLKDFLSKHDVKKLDRMGLELLLGNSDGYYLYDEFPAYRLKLEGDCVIAFPINRNTGQIKDALIEPIDCEK